MPGRFVTPLVVESLATDDRRNARLARPLVFEARDGARLVVPAGFTTDLASIPQALQAVIGKWERHAPAAVLHDWLYARQITSRRQADWLFASALHAAGVPVWKRAAMWMAVRAGGGRAWRRSRRGLPRSDQKTAASRTRSPGGHMPRRVPQYAELEAEYQTLWSSMEIRADRLSAITATARRIIAARDRYQMIAASSGVPWHVVGVIHAMECGLRFDRHLHNGDPLTRRTVQVPAGRPATGNGPFTFEDSACDALAMKRLDAVEHWDIPRIAYELERYNGWGYRLYHPEVASPYLWSGTRHYTRGKYVADGQWSATAVSGQSGAMAILKRISELDLSVVLDAPEPDPAAEFVRTPEVAEGGPATMLHSSTGNTSVMVGGGAGVPQVGMAASDAAARSTTMKEFLVALLAHPMFWTGLLTVAGTVYIWLERRRKLIVHGV